MCGCALKPSFADSPARSISLANPAVVNGDPRSDVNTKGDFGSCSRWSLRRARDSSPRMGCVAGVPRLAPADGHGCGIEINLIPAQIDQLRRSEAMPICHQDHAGVPVAVAIVPGRLHQLLDLGLSQVFAAAQLGIGLASRGNCSFYGVRGDQLQMRFRHDFQGPLQSTVGITVQ
jgi:hypothetical protein